MALLMIGFILGAIAAAVFLPVIGVSAGKTFKQNLPLILVFLAVPLLAGLIYWKIGSPQAVSVAPPASMPPAQMSNAPAMPGNGHEMGDMEAMAEKLAAKLEKSPDNGDNWALLARTYVEVKQHDKAVGAFEKAANLIQNDAQLLADYADALAMTNQSKFDEKSKGLVDKALQIDAKNPKALLLAGTIAFNESEYQKAIDFWKRLQPLIGKEDELLSKEVEANISEATSLLAKASK